VVAFLTTTPSAATGDDALDLQRSIEEARGEGALDLDTEDGVVRQSPEEALAQDLALVAEATG